MKRGLFISFEGSDGSGKSTQLKLIKTYLEQNGYSLVITREPGGTPIGEKIRDVLLDKENASMTPVTEALLYAAARAQLVNEVIKPSIAEGRIVICDRFIDSSIAYQGYGRGLGEPVRIINEFAVAGRMPDKTFLFKLNYETLSKRVGVKNKDRLESEQVNFFSEVLRGYAELEKRYPDRIIGIDGAGSIEEVHLKIRSLLDDVLKEKYDIQ